MKTVAPIPLLAAIGLLGVVDDAKLSLSEQLGKRDLVTRTAGSKVIDGAVHYVEDAGICETTPGVKQYSGYVELARDQHLWFWLFEARTDPEKAPFALWLNGGPGCTSLIGLFQENGPCHVDDDGTMTTLNPHSWNEYANMIYVDQPIGTGFSYGNATVNSTAGAAPAVWKFFQVLFTSGVFSKYKARAFGMWTESFGGHYGPVFAEYFISQNQKISEGSVKGEKIHLIALGISNGSFDPKLQLVSSVDFAQAKWNGYFDLVNATVIEQARAAVEKCQTLEDICYKTGHDEDCIKAKEFCDEFVLRPPLGHRAVDNILRNTSDSWPSTSYLRFISNSTIQSAIGIESNFAGHCSAKVYAAFRKTGDSVRTTLPSLAKVADSGLRTLIWAGDLDYNCNWLGGVRAMEAMTWSRRSEFIKSSWKPLEFKGQVYGVYRTAGNFSFVRVFAAGHGVPPYQPVISLELFKQTMQLQAPHSVP